MDNNYSKELGVINQPNNSVGYTNNCSLILANYNIKPKQMVCAATCTRYANGASDNDQAMMSAGIYDKNTDSFTVSKFGSAGTYGYLAYEQGVRLYIQATKSWTGRSRIILFYYIE